MVTSASTLQELSANVQFDPDNETAKLLGGPGGEHVESSYALSKFMGNRAVQLLAKDPALLERRITVSMCAWCEHAQQQQRGDSSSVRADQRGPPRQMQVLLLQVSQSHLTGGG